LRFASSRLVEPRAVARIAHSIERCGQVVPCIVVAVSDGAGGEPLVLIDGYRRVAALRRLGRDTASVEQWTCDLADALLGLLARTQNRPFASIEEALLVRELMQGLGLSQHDLARRCGRDVSWVSRRLQLLSGLPDAALTAVRDGTLSSWSANRIVVPLARANTELALKTASKHFSMGSLPTRIAITGTFKNPSIRPGAEVAARAGAVAGLAALFVPLAILPTIQFGTSEQEDARCSNCRLASIAAVCAADLRDPHPTRRRSCDCSDLWHLGCKILAESR
jgi:ParB/RepB/Spo0J family partition protein